jgi:hypothetical protein
MVKKTCANCKALDNGNFQGDDNQICKLGYNQQIGTLHAHGTWFYTTIMKPAEECPKPITNMELVNAKHK